MVWLPNSEKILMICLFVSTEFTNVTLTQTDRQTPHDDMGRACIALRSKNRFYGHSTFALQTIDMIY